MLQEGTNSTIVINYERSASNLVETTYSVNYVYDTYNMVVTDGVAGYPATPDTHEEVLGLTVKGYVGQRVTIADGAKPDFVVEGTNPATSQILKEGDNTYTFRYVHRNPLSQVNVTVNHHYTTKTIAVDGTVTSSTDVVYGTPVPKYVDETYEATLRLDGFDYERYTVTEGIAAVQDETSKNVTVKATGNVTVDFYYTKTFNNSQPVNYSIQHIYKTIDWTARLPLLLRIPSRPAALLPARSLPVWMTTAATSSWFLRPSMVSLWRILMPRIPRMPTWSLW